MTQLVRMMAIANGNSSIAPGTVLVTDSVSARTQPQYFQIELTGTSSQRPKAGDPAVPNLPAGTSFFDSTLGYTIYWDGSSWRNPNTGSVV